MSADEPGPADPRGARAPAGGEKSDLTPISPPPLPDPAFWRGRRVLLTGHTGFVGAWTALWLGELGAEVTGLALPPDRDPSLYAQLAPWPALRSRLVDLRDAGAVHAAVDEANPELVLHLAAQSLVRRGYAEPAATFGTNVAGAAHLLDALRDREPLRAALVVTTDKVYAHGDGDPAGLDRARHRAPFTEHDPLGGDDPYSASKAAAELVAAAWARSFFDDAGVPLATARAGNLIGGGDRADDRLLPDLWRAARAGRAPVLRHPAATRPWLYVLDAIAGYLRYLEALASASSSTTPRALNFGPPPDPAIPVSTLTEAFLGALGADPGWSLDPGPHPPEKPALALDVTRAADTLGWRPRLPLDRAIRWTARWYRDVDEGADPRATSLAQLAAFHGAPR